MDRPQPLIEHLTELRRRMIHAVIAVVVCMAVALVFAHSAFIYLMETAVRGTDLKVVQYTFADAFLTEVRLAVIAGFVLAFPFVLYQVVAFVMPALRPGERRILLAGLPLASLLFVVGWLFGWFAVVPLTRSFFLSVSTSAGVENLITPSSYISFVLGICNPLGIVFELPLVVLTLARIGFVSASLLGRIRKFAFLGAAILAAVLSPPDVISMGIFMVPLYGLYELSVLLARWAEPKQTETAS